MHHEDHRLWTNSLCLRDRGVVTTPLGNTCPCGSCAGPMKLCNDSLGDFVCLVAVTNLNSTLPVRVNNAKHRERITFASERCIADRHGCIFIYWRRRAKCAFGEPMDGRLDHANLVGVVLPSE
jgi:hypothetical protein